MFASNELSVSNEWSRLETMAPRSDRKRDQFTVVLEDIRDKFETIVEETKPIPNMQRRLNDTFEEVGKLREDMEVVKEAVKEHSRILNT